MSSPNISPTNSRWPIAPPSSLRRCNAILKCRTAALGGHLRVCDVCGRVQMVFNSCGNRNCPKCGACERAQWLAQQGARLLPVPHFHVVFTLDHRVNPLAEVNPEAVYDLLFSTANQTLKAFAQQYLGGQIGVTAVLHTWGQTLQHHIHLHCMVTGGALAQTQSGYDNRERDEQERGQPKIMTLPAVEFIRRFLMHVLPFQYKRVRHFGLYASANRAVLGVARGLLGGQPLAPPAKLSLSAWLATFVTGDPSVCPCCGVGRMQLGRAFAPIRGVALWLLILLGLPVAGRPAAEPAA